MSKGSTVVRGSCDTGLGRWHDWSQEGSPGEEDVPSPPGVLDDSPGNPTVHDSVPDSTRKTFLPPTPTVYSGRSCPRRRYVPELRRLGKTGVPTSVNEE